MAPIIALLSDFGIRDGYVASLKGVILGICPRACLVDITHLVSPQDIRGGAFVLSTVYRDFPTSTIYLTVVDPGVGTERRALAVQTSDYFFVGPDNGLFSWILKENKDWKAHSLDNPRFWRPAISHTFHGRDIFAPVAAHLANGMSIDHFGPPCSPQIASWASIIQTEEMLQGEVLFIDHFGNVITNFTEEDAKAFSPRNHWEIRIGDRSISNIVHTYGQAKAGELIALVGSSGHLEIAVNQGHAARRLEIAIGDPIFLFRRPLPFSSK